MNFQVRGLTFDLLQRKVKGLEDDNRKLRAEASQLASDSSESEEKEEQLFRDVIAQLSECTISVQQQSSLIFVCTGEANNQIKCLDEELASKYDESSKQREEITSLLGQLVEQRQKIRDVR